MKNIPKTFLVIMVGYLSLGFTTIAQCVTETEWTDLYSEINQFSGAATPRSSGQSSGINSPRTPRAVKGDAAKMEAGEISEEWKNKVAEFLTTLNDPKLQAQNHDNEQNLYDLIKPNLMEFIFPYIEAINSLIGNDNIPGYIARILFLTADGNHITNQNTYEIYYQRTLRQIDVVFNCAMDCKKRLQPVNVTTFFDDFNVTIEEFIRAMQTRIVPDDAPNQPGLGDPPLQLKLLIDENTRQQYAHDLVTKLQTSIITINAPVTATTAAPEAEQSAEILSPPPQATEADPTLRPSNNWFFHIKSFSRFFERLSFDRKRTSSGPGTPTRTGTPVVQRSPQASKVAEGEAAAASPCQHTTEEKAAASPCQNAAVTTRDGIWVRGLGLISRLILPSSSPSKDMVPQQVTLSPLTVSPPPKEQSTSNVKACPPKIDGGDRTIRRPLLNETPAAPTVENQEEPIEIIPNQTIPNAPAAASSRGWLGFIRDTISDA